MSAQNGAVTSGESGESFVRKGFVPVLFLGFLLFFSGYGTFAQSRDIRTQATYGADSEHPRTKWEYYHDMWSERDVKHGRYSEWTASDELLVEGYYFDGAQDSIWKYWYLNGKLKEVSWWDAGLRNGTTSRFDRKGRLLEETNFRIGKTEGLTYTYYQNGKVKTLGQYLQGQRHGNFTCFSRRGASKAICQYDQGRLVSKVMTGKSQNDSIPSKRSASPKTEQLPSEHNHRSKRVPKDPNNKVHTDQVESSHGPALGGEKLGKKSPEKVDRKSEPPTPQKPFGTEKIAKQRDRKTQTP